VPALASWNETGLRPGSAGNPDGNRWEPKSVRERAQKPVAIRNQEIPRFRNFNRGVALTWDIQSRRNA